MAPNFEIRQTASSPSLPNGETHARVYVRARVRVRMHACACVCECVCMRALVRVRVSVAILIQVVQRGSAKNRHML